MTYLLLAVATFGLHVAFVAFVVAGGFLVHQGPARKIAIPLAAHLGPVIYYPLRRGA
jgi:hypothetical protein